MSNLEENKTLETQIMPGAFCSLLIGKGFSTKSLSNTSDNVEVILVKPEEIVEVATFLKIHKETQFDMLFSVSGVDTPENFAVVYHLISTRFKHKLILKSYLNKNNPEIDSLSQVFKAADWHERETYDLLGIKFNNHPNLTRILLPNDWKGHPLRKDYKQDDERLAWNER